MMDSFIYSFATCFFHNILPLFRFSGVIPLYLLVAVTMNNVDAARILMEKKANLYAKNNVRMCQPSPSVFALRCLFVLCTCINDLIMPFICRLWWNVLGGKIGEGFGDNGEDESADNGEPYSLIYSTTFLRGEVVLMLKLMGCSFLNVCLSVLSI